MFVIRLHYRRNRNIYTSFASYASYGGTFHLRH